MPDAPVISVSDRDHDGVPDTSDNCPDVANPDQTANEDGDRFGDVCDLCPQLPDNAPTDGDRDGIGDACDPNPAAADKVWLFEGFHKGLPAWPGSTNWSPTSDQIRVTAGGNATDPGEYLILPLTSTGRTFDNFSITVSILVEQVMGSRGDHDIGISIFDETTNQGLWCEMYQQGTLPTKNIVDLGDDNTLGTSAPFAWVNNTTYRLSLVRRGSSYTCSVVGPIGTQTVSLTSQIVPRSGAAVTIEAFGVTGRFASVFVAGP
jgi:hypothetical protein